MLKLIPQGNDSRPFTKIGYNDADGFLFWVERRGDCLNFHQASYSDECIMRIAFSDIDSLVATLLQAKEHLV